jgi:hypothetical protein
MSGSNDALTQFMMMQMRQQGRRPSTQAQLAQQMMASLNNPQPIYGAGPAIARVGSGVLAGLMGGMAERSDREREDQQLQQMQDRQDKADFNNRRELAEFLGGGAPQAPQTAPQPPMPMGAAPMPMGNAAPSGAVPYGRNAGMVAQRDALLEAPPEQLAAASAARSGATGIPEIPGGYRANPGTDGAFAGLAPPSGVVNPNIGGNPGGRPAAPQGDAMSMYQRAASSPNPLIRAMAPGFLAQANREDVRANRPPTIVSPGSTALGPDNRPIFTAPERPQAPDELARLFAAAGVDPNSEDGRAIARRMLERRGQPPQTNVSVDNRADGALMRADTDTLKAINEGQGQARSVISLLDRAERAVRQIPEGQAARLMPVLGQTLASFGVQLPNTSEAEVLNALTSQLAGLQRIPGSGATTDYEMRLFMQAVPRLGNTREGNLALLDMGRRLAQRRIEEAAVWRRHVGQPDLMDRLDALGPVFGERDMEVIMNGVAPQPAPQPARPPGMVDRARQRNAPQSMPTLPPGFEVVQ